MLAQDDNSRRAKHDMERLRAVLDMHKEVTVTVTLRSRSGHGRVLEMHKGRATRITGVTVVTGVRA